MRWRARAEGRCGGGAHAEGRWEGGSVAQPLLFPLFLQAQGAPHGFALDMSHFERESERGQLLQPHLAAVRTQLLDYFRATAANVPDDHLLFRFERSMALAPADKLLMRQLSLQLGFPRDDASLARSLSGEDSAVEDLLPELPTIRDIAFYLKVAPCLMPDPYLEFHLDFHLEMRHGIFRSKFLLGIFNNCWPFIGSLFAW